MPKPDTNHDLRERVDLYFAAEKAEAQADYAEADGAARAAYTARYVATMREAARMLRAAYDD